MPKRKITKIRKKNKSRKIKRIKNKRVNSRKQKRIKSKKSRRKILIKYNHIGGSIVWKTGEDIDIDIVDKLKYINGDFYKIGNKAKMADAYKDVLRHTTISTTDFYDIIPPVGENHIVLFKYIKKKIKDETGVTKAREEHIQSQINNNAENFIPLAKYLNDSIIDCIQFFKESF